MESLNIGNRDIDILTVIAAGVCTCFFEVEMIAVKPNFLIGDHNELEQRILAEIINPGGQKLTMEGAEVQE